ncbi:hypothetical protein FH972_022638 [Carpinus fangiana]|uniref:ubiquitinyl hydrolase 1 n=1 Tax=Carpinus fangiana TaxID=176857 RepID=A0A5N6KST1_9ROSI|nr:hypothetical protein FH972_022638 [Carpinus fangiana]
MVHVRTKTAPALLQDLLGFDPRDVAALDRNHSCQHAYCTVPDRSRLPALDEVPNATTHWNVVSVCQRCRCHVELDLTFPGASLPCPSRGAPLHVFEWQDPLPEDERGAAPIHRFVCDTSTCRAVLKATVRKPILDQAYVAILTEPNHLKRRYKVAFAQHPSLQEIVPVQALATLRAYVQGAVGDGRAKKIPVRNKRFMYALGEDARELLIKLGFTYARDADASNDNWEPPGYDRDIDSDTLEILLDCRDELILLMQQRPEAEKMELKEVERAEMYGAPPTIRDMERLLGMLDSANLTFDSNAYRLGCLPNFSDDLIAWAYDRLILIHPEDAPTTFDHLRKIAAERQSESLQLKATMLESEGQQSREAVRKAYFQLGYGDFDSAGSASDDELLGTYQARVPDIGPDQQHDLKLALKTIADWRNSHLLKQACSDKIETYEQALLYLDASAETSDDFIIPLYTAKLADAGAGDERPREALLIIAKKRNSAGLQGYLDQGEVPAPLMDIQQAYLTFGIEGGSSVDDQFILDAFSISIAEAPGRTKDFRNALSVIAKERNSPSLQSALQDAATHTTQFQAKSAPDEPRGLGNLANTCYMNTLFQWFFYIKPIRERVLNFDEYKEDPASRAVFKEKVGDMNVRKKEVVRAQRFVQALEVLFKEMITIRNDYPAGVARNPTERADYPTPSVELARLTLAPVTQNAARRRSTISSLPGTARALSSPHLERFPTRSETSSIDHGNAIAITDSPVEQNLHGYMKGRQTSDDSSSGSMGQAVAEEVPSSDSLGMEVITQKPDDIHPEVKPETPLTVVTKDIAPPVPPRPRIDSVDDLATMEQLATQQDVSEAVENMLHQFSWAFKPETGSNSGAIDVVSKLFYGKDSMENLNALRKRKSALTETPIKLTIPDAITSLNEHLEAIRESAEELGLSDLSVDEDLSQHLDARAKAAQQEIEAIDARILQLEAELEGLFEKGGQLTYRLHSVFVHTGDQTGSGHWYIYIFDPAKKIWRWFNDGQVVEVKDVRDIFSPQKDAHGHSTLVAYVRADQQDAIMDTVRREQPKDAPQEFRQPYEEAAYLVAVLFGGEQRNQVDAGPHLLAAEFAGEGVVSVLSGWAECGGDGRGLGYLSSRTPWA